MNSDHHVSISEDKDRLFEYCSDVRTSVSIHSNLLQPLVVRQRNGVCSVTRPKHGAGYQSGSVTIQLELLLNKEVFLYIEQQSMETLPEEYQILYKSIQTMQDRGAEVGGRLAARINLTYSHAFFERHGGQFYLAIADIVLSILPQASTDEHPYSVSTIQKQLSGRIQNDYEGLALYAVRLVDRLDQIGPRYINVSGDVFRIDPLSPEETTDQFGDGLHILGTQPMRNPKDIAANARTTYIPIDKLLVDPIKYGLYTTYGEARHQGNKPLETAQNALDEARRAADKKDRTIEGLKRDLEEAKVKHKQEGSFVMHKGLTELLKLATAMIGIVKLLK